MGKVILEFDSIEEATDARTALDGYKWKLAMWDLDQVLRSCSKHGLSLTEHNKPATEEESAVMYEVRDKIRDILSHYNINFED